jgi:hypothetical protein
MNNNTIPVVFHGGCYGTFLHWVLETLTSDAKIVDPLTMVGNSHKFNGSHLLSMEGWRRYYSSDAYCDFVRFHPKTTKQENLFDNLTEISNQVNRFVYVYPDQNTVFLCLFNHFGKIWKDWWTYNFTHDTLSPSVIYDNWNVSSDTPLDQIPHWVRREFLSFYAIPMWYSMIEWDCPTHYTQDNCCLVTVSDLLFNFKPTVEKIVDALDLKVQTSVDQLLPYHSKMISLQTFLNSTKLCNSIISSITTPTDILNWGQLSLIEEAWLQWQLRNLGYELKCNGLDIFPTNSVQLQELLYKA